MDFIKTHGSLFSGMGGFDLAAEWMGWENIFHCELNPFGQKILKYYWPNAKSYEDIKKSDFTIYRGRIGVLSGGFPCQPYSSAGKRLGKEDERHLWPEMLRAIREIQPSYVVGENVRGLTNWNGGLVFDEVQADLESQGYEVLPFLLPAAGVGAPHRRDRIWFIAYATLKRCREARPGFTPAGNERAGSIGMQLPFADTGGDGQRSDNELGENRCKTGADEAKQQRPERDNPEREWIRDDNRRAFTEGASSNTNELDGDISGLRAGKASQLEEAGVFIDPSADASVHRSERQPWRGGDGSERRILSQRDSEGSEPFRGSEIITDTDSEQRREGRLHPDRSETTERYISTRNAFSYERGNWDLFPTQPPIRTRNDGIPGKLDGITVPKWRDETIKAAGNAIVPQVAFQIFKAISEM